MGDFSAYAFAAGMQTAQLGPSPARLGGPLSAAAAAAAAAKSAAAASEATTGKSGSTASAATESTSPTSSPTTADSIAARLHHALQRVGNS